MARRTILVVDDDELVLQVTKSMVEYGGYSVVTASNGLDALRVYDENRGVIDLVLTDVKMPNMDGVALAERILQSGADAPPIVFMTGYRSGADAYQMASKFGPQTSSLIRKPFRVNDLLSLISAAFVKAGIA